MTSYKVIFHPHVIRRDLPKLPKKDASRIIERIKRLADDPRPSGSTKLSNREELRLRQGNWRVLYVVDDNERIVQIVKVRHRSEVYK